MTQCEDCKTMKKADNCIKCAVDAMAKKAEAESKLKKEQKANEGRVNAYKQQKAKREQKIAKLETDIKTLDEDRSRLNNLQMQTANDYDYMREQYLKVKAKADWLMATVRTIYGILLNGSRIFHRKNAMAEAWNIASEALEGEK